MHKKKDRIIIDTNLWISFLLTKTTSKLDKIFSNNSSTLIFSQELLNEFVDVANRPKLKRYFNLTDLEDLIHQIRLHSEFIYVISNVDLCRDPKDNFLLSLAKDGKANYLLTGDKDLLELNVIGRTKILTIAEFLLEHK